MIHNLESEIRGHNLVSMAVTAKPYGIFATVAMEVDFFYTGHDEGVC
jgi:hypothetical protein